VSPGLWAEGSYLPQGPGFLLHPTTALPQRAWGKARHGWRSPSALRCSAESQSAAVPHLRLGEKAAQAAASNASHCTGPPVPTEGTTQRFTPDENVDACHLKADLFLFQKV